MDRDQVIRALKVHEQELRAAGVVSVSLFGSTARGESDPHDVDIAVRLAENFSHGGFDYFGRLEDLEQHLSQLLGCKVDVVEEPVRKERLQKEIDRDRAWKTSSRMRRRPYATRLTWMRPPSRKTAWSTTPSSAAWRGLARRRPHWVS